MMNRSFSVYSLHFILFIAFLVCIVPVARWAVDYLSAAETILSLKDAVRVRSFQGGISQSVKAIGKEGRVAIFAHPPSRLEWTIRVREGIHRFRVAVGLDREVWDEGKSDGAVFRGFVIQGGDERELFEVYLNPGREVGHKQWVPISASLECDGGLLILALETTGGPAEDRDFDWAYWGEPRILEGTEPPDLRWFLSGFLVFIFCIWLRRKGREGSTGSTPNRITILQATSLTCLSLLVVVGFTEGLFQLFPRLFPFSAYRYLPDKGLHYFRQGTQRDRYDREIAHLRRPYVRWSWRRHDDLVLMHLVSEVYATSNVPVIRFETDSEGFRNPRDLGVTEIIALGDSCTEAPHVQVGETWPSVLAQALGVQVRNLGMSGYSPQQCLIALRRFGLPRSPRVVLFPLFEGNDIMDATQFKQYQDSHMMWPEFLVKSRRALSRSVVYRRLSFSFAWATLKYAGSLLRPFLPARLASVRSAETFPFNPVKGEVAGSPIQMAFYNRYLYYSTFSRSKWTEHEGWSLSREALLEAKRLCDETSANFIVVLIPSKGSIYLPLLADCYEPHEFDRYVGRMTGRPPRDGRTWHEDFLMNHRVLSELAQEFCVSNGIDCIDLRPALEKAAARGELVYFPLDTHWNPQGHRIAGEMIASALRERGLFGERR